jgi:hypothetical protein
MLAMLVCGCLVLLGLSAVGDGRRARPVADELAAARLTDDDGGAALFAAHDLLPGNTVTRCLQVRYAGGGPGQVRLTAADVAGPLTPSLSVRVAVGTGGGFAGCAGFTGPAFYTGDQAGLGAGTGEAAGVPAAWTPDGADTRTYQITVEVLPTAVDGQWAAATFRWLFIPAPGRPLATPDAPQPAVPSPALTPATPQPRPTTAPGGHATPARGGGTGRGSGGASSPAQPPLTQAIQDIQHVLHDSAVVGVRVAKRSPVPAVFLAVLLLFLAGQGRLDRGDPKLAKAPMWPVPYLTFEGEEES